MPLVANFFGGVAIDYTEVPLANIVEVQIKEWVFDLLPRITLVIRDIDGVVDLKGITSTSIIYVNVKKNEKSVTGINTEFQVRDYHFKETGAGYDVVISGHLKVNNIWAIKSMVYPGQTSKNLLTALCAEIGTTPSPDPLLATADPMDWMQLNESTFDFVQHVLKHSSVPNDKLLMFSGIDGKTKITSVGSLIKVAPLLTTKYSSDEVGTDILLPSTDLYYQNVDFKSIVSTLMLEGGYGQKVEMIDNISGAVIPGDLPVPGPLYGGLPKHDVAGFTGKQVEYYFDGVNDITNTYPDYNAATHRNEKILKEFFGISINVEVNPMQVINLGMTVNALFRSASPVWKGVDTPNKHMSGPALITGITHYISPMAGYKKVVHMSKNGTGV